MHAFRQIGLVGTGRVAAALALALAPHSRHPLLILGRSASRRQALIDRTPGTAAARDTADLAARCDAIAIAVADDSLANVVADLAKARPAGFVFHVSGRSGVAVLAPIAAHGATVAAIHPVMTFTGDAGSEAARLRGARCAITGGDAAGEALARQIVACLGSVPVIVAEHHRALYHAALCHAANHLVTLLAGSTRALASAGIADPSALLAPLVRAALDNSLTHGFAALSGPLLRGDDDTIAGHLAALAHDDPDLLPAYRAMALATLDEMERAGLTPTTGLREKLQAQ